MQLTNFTSMRLRFSRTLDLTVTRRLYWPLVSTEWFGPYNICLFTSPQLTPSHRTIAVTCFVLFVADAVGRRWSLIASGVVMFLCMFYLGFYSRYVNIEAGALGASSYVALVAIYIFAAAFQLGWGPVCWIYVSEIPSSRLRGLNVALAAATQWLFNFAVARATPVMLNTVGVNGFGTYFIYGCFSFAIIVGVWFLIPETKGISLERMDELFGTTNFGDIEDVGEAALRKASLDEQHEVHENKS